MEYCFVFLKILTTLLPANSLFGPQFCHSQFFYYFTTTELSIWMRALCFATFDHSSTIKFCLDHGFVFCYLFDCFAIIELSIWIMISIFCCYLLSTMLSPNSLLLDHDFSLRYLITTIHCHHQAVSLWIIALIFCKLLSL